MSGPQKTWDKSHWVPVAPPTLLTHTLNHPLPGADFSFSFLYKFYHFGYMPSWFPFVLMASWLLVPSLVPSPLFPYHSSLSPWPGSVCWKSLVWMSLAVLCLISTINLLLNHTSLLLFFHPDCAPGLRGLRFPSYPPFPACPGRLPDPFSGVHHGQNVGFVFLSYSLADFNLKMSALW